MKNKTKQKIEQGGRPLGTFFELGSLAAAQCLAIAGLDFVIIDTEHGPGDVESALPAIHALERHGAEPFVRVREISRPAVLKMLDIGAKGLIVPCVDTVSQVRQLVEYAKFAPVGRRGFAPTSAGAFGYAPHAKNPAEYFETCNAETLLLPQCETLGCLEHIEEIAAMEGVDGIFVGPLDLSVALGVPARMDAPELLAAIARILSACKKHGKISMIFAPNIAAAKRHFESGFDSVSCCMDAMVLIEAYKKLIADIRA